MTKFNPNSSFVTSLMRGRRYDSGKTMSKKDVIKALLEMEHEGQQSMPHEPDSGPTAKNVLDRSL